MASKNQVTLTFAGDADKLTKSFEGVNASADKLTGTFDRASKSADEHNNKLGALIERADNSERSLIGVHDVIDGTATIMQGPGKAGITAYVQGWADLAGGLAPLLIQMSEMKLATLAQKAATIEAAIAQKAAAAAQWLWNAAMSANPIGLVVLAIAALVAAIILVIKYHKQIAEVAVAAWNGIKAAAVAVADAVSGAFKKAFNTVADAWNNTIGRLSWSVPSWIPFIGGNTVSVPKLPHFHSGGVVPDVPGGEMLAVLQSGETVTPRGGGGAGRLTVSVAPGGDTGVATLIQYLFRRRLIQLKFDGTNVVVA